MNNSCCVIGKAPPRQAELATPPHPSTIFRLHFDYAQCGVSI